MGVVEGKVALVTGAARGQGRSHAVRLAEEGAALVLCDACAPVASIPYDLPGPEELAETVRLVEAAGARVVADRVDVRDLDGLTALVARAEAELGTVDVVCANAGIVSYAKAWEFTSEQWQDLLDVNLTGVWHTVKATIPSMIAADRGGSIVITASLAGLVPYAGSAAYVASKHGVNGLMKVLALDLGEHRIRVNSINPSTVDTPMIQNEPTYRLFAPDREGAISREEFEDIARPLHALPIPYITPGDVSELVLWLASDASRHMTGTAIRLDAGAGLK